MGFFGGMGAGKGWHTFRAVATPAELESVLASSGCVLVSDNPVASDYEQTRLADYLEAYTKLYERMGETDPADHSVDSAIRLSASKSRDVYRSRPSNIPDIKVISPVQPVVNLAPGSLYFNGRLMLGTSGGRSTAFGLEMTFPKVVYFDHEDMAKPHRDAEFPNFDLFNSLTEELEAITRPVRIQSPERVHKPRARISDSAKADLHGRSYLRQHSLTLL